MAIKPIGTLREKYVAAPGSGLSGGPRRFEQLLQEQLPQNQPLCGDQARSLAALMKLEMTAGLLSWDSDEKRGPFTLPALPRTSVMTPAAISKKFHLVSENRPSVSSQPVSLLPDQPQAACIEQLIDKAAQRYQVAPELIKAVIQAESSFNPKAVSPAGAQGLMQLMPATARELGVEDSFDPEQNIMGGTRYLRDLLRRYDGDLDSTLAAYNWGMGNLARSDGWLPEETRTYQTRVKQFLAQYQQTRVG
jgi:hypothetical protein